MELSDAKSFTGLGHINKYLRLLMSYLGQRIAQYRMFLVFLVLYALTLQHGSAS